MVAVVAAPCRNLSPGICPAREMEISWHENPLGLWRNSSFVEPTRSISQPLWRGERASEADWRDISSTFICLHPHLTSAVKEWIGCSRRYSRTRTRYKIFMLEILFHFKIMQMKYSSVDGGGGGKVDGSFRVSTLPFSTRSAGPSPVGMFYFLYQKKDNFFALFWAHKVTRVFICEFTDSNKGLINLSRPKSEIERETVEE